MSDTAQSLRDLAAPWVGGERVKSVIDRAARRAGLKFSRAYEIWYGRARRIEDFEREAIAAALDKKRREAARNELHELRTSIARLESSLAQIDPDFHRPSIDAARNMAGPINGKRGASDSSVD